MANHHVPYVQIQYDLDPATQLTIRIKRSARSRTYRLALQGHHIIATVPQKTSEGQIQNFFHQSESWLKKMALVILEQEKTIQPYLLPPASEKILLGKSIHAITDPVLYHKKLQEILLETIENVSKRYHHLGVPKGYKIRSTSGQWGSLVRTGFIHINPALVFAPLEVLEYVLCHEHVHIQHKNHKKSFWNAVAKNFPAYKEAEKWLKQHSGLLFPLSEKWRLWAKGVWA